MNALVVVTYLGIVFQVYLAPVGLEECRQGIAEYMSDYLASWARAGVDSSKIKITCEPVGAVKLIEGEPT